MNNNFCTNCLQYFKDALSYICGARKVAADETIACEIFKYPYKSCRELLALKIVQDEYVKYLEKKVHEEKSKLA